MGNDGKILIVDDDADFLRYAALNLRQDGYGVETAGSAAEGLAKLASGDCEVLLLDVKLPDRPGTAIIPEALAVRPGLPIVMVSARGESAVIVEAIKAGAHDYIRKPVDRAELSEKVRAALEIGRLRDVGKAANEEAKDAFLIGQGTVMRRLLRQVETVVGADAPVFIHGETGTGKTRLAELIHRRSRRSRAKFVVIDCASIPETLLETELFGHEKGAFTGAHHQKTGKFEHADGGTVLLDEIGEMPLTLQAKLLRVIQGREFERVGGLKTIAVDIRLIAATNRDIEREIAAGKFREDLYYRLTVLPLYLPSLRERRDDIPLLLRHFIGKFCDKHHRGPFEMEPACEASLTAYDWPGNVRELENAVERAVLYARPPVLKPDDFTLGHGRVSPNGRPNAVVSLRDIAYKNLVEAVEKSGGSVTKMAALLGVGRDTIYRRLKKHGISFKK